MTEKRTPLEDKEFKQILAYFHYRKAIKINENFDLVSINPQQLLKEGMMLIGMNLFFQSMKIPTVKRKRRWKKTEEPVEL